MVDIAIADDSEAIRNLIEEILRYEDDCRLVASFDNGREIVAWARDGGRADVFVIDMRLPGLSGTATINALRRHLADARILAFSASAQEESIKAALAAGADNYLVKDASLSDLLSAITAPVDGRSSAEPAAREAAVAAPAASEPAPKAPGDGLSVLVIDDHDLVLAATVALLEARGFEVQACDTAQKARDLLESGNKPDAALVDLRLGDESGADMVEDFRRLTPRTAVLLHSGAGDQDGERVVRDTGADGFLAKGDYTIDEMVTTVTAAISARQPA